MGVSVEDERVTNRIDDLRKVLRQCGSFMRAINWSALELNLKGIDWVIVGGESGARPRPMKRNGRQAYAINVKSMMLPSFSNNGEVVTKRLPGGNWKVPTMTPFLNPRSGESRSF